MYVGNLKRKTSEKLAKGEKGENLVRQIEKWNNKS